MAKIRTFIAIEIPEQVKTKIAALQNQLKKENERVSWTKSDNIHLTLKFLGNVEENQIELMAQKLHKALQNVSSFHFAVKNLGGFPNLKRPRVLWVGIEEPTHQLSALAKKIEDALAEMGFPKEKRKFSPHLTLGRVKTALSRKFLQKFTQLSLEAGTVQVEEVVIMKSTLKPTGAEYSPLKRIKLTH